MLIGRVASLLLGLVLTCSCALPLPNPRVEKPRAPLDQSLAVVHQDGTLRLIRGVNCPGIYTFTVSIEHNIVAQRCGDRQTEVKTFNLSDLSGLRSLKSRELSDTNNWAIVGPDHRPSVLIPFGKNQKYTTIGKFDPLSSVFKSSGLVASEQFLMNFRRIDDCLVLLSDIGNDGFTVFIPTSDIDPITLLPILHFKISPSSSEVMSCKVADSNGQRTAAVITRSSLEFSRPDEFRQPDGSYEYRGRKLTRVGDKLYLDGYGPQYDRNWEREVFSLPNAASGLKPTLISREAHILRDVDTPNHRIDGVWLDANEIRIVSPLTGKARTWPMPDLGPPRNEIKSSRDLFGVFTPEQMRWFAIGSIEEQELRFFVMRSVCLKALCEYDEASSALSLIVCDQACTTQNWTLPQTGVASFEIRSISRDRRSIALETSMFHDGQPNEYLLVVDSAT